MQYKQATEICVSRQCPDYPICWRARGAPEMAENGEAFYLARTDKCVLGLLDARRMVRDPRLDSHIWKSVNAHH